MQPEYRSHEEMGTFKGTFWCNQYNKYGHWANNYKSDGTLRHGANSTDSNITTSTYKYGSSFRSANTNQQNCKKRNMIGFNVSPSSLEEIIHDNTALENRSDFNIDTLVDDGVAYSAIDEVEFKLMKTRDPSDNYELEPKPKELEQ